MADLLGGVRDAVEAEDAGGPQPPPPTGEFKMPSVQELLAALENMTGISDEDKASLRESLLAGKVLTRPTAAAAANATGGSPQIVVLLVLVAAVLLLLSFFGYKLYKSLVEKERRREEKRKLKMQKKKK